MNSFEHKFKQNLGATDSRVMILSNSELNSLLEELSPKVDTDEHRLELGLGAYRLLFKAYPEFISKYSRLQGCTADNVMESDGVKYYAATFVERLVAILSIAADADALDAALDQLGKDHIERDVSMREFEKGAKIFINYFKTSLVKPENKASMTKFLKFIMPEIAAYFY